MKLRRRFPRIARGRKAKPVGKAVKPELRKRIVTEKVFRDFAEIRKGPGEGEYETMEYFLANLCSRQTRHFVKRFIYEYSIRPENPQALEKRIQEYAGKKPELRAKRLKIIVEVSRQAVHEINTLTEELYKMAQTPEVLAEHGEEAYNIRHFVCLLTTSTANNLSTLGHRAHKMLERMQ